MKFFKRDPLEEEIDSNCLWAILQYVRKSNEQAMNFLKVLEPRKIEFIRKCSRILCILSTPDWLTNGTLSAAEINETVSDLVKFKWNTLIEPCFTLLELLIHNSADFALVCITGKETDNERSKIAESTGLE